VEVELMNDRQKRVTRIKSDYMHQYDVHMERNRRRKRKLLQRLIIFSTVAIIILGVITSYHVKQRGIYAEKQEENENLTEEIADLKIQEKELVEEINLLNDEEYVLDIARTNYFLSKKGELIFQLDDPEERSY